ncbi:hypothetical protein LUZ61_009529 [Rhynchospora tenuis]|uniref:Uncharacterized protein n=1 Tax=Rhynchospora tenuis TaxID=198213 RepID=A0AAD5ZXQ7_9POAL|nr:hypothetical protein LUZ61_009529 [Rhynchospora tenuis]
MRDEMWLEIKKAFNIEDDRGKERTLKVMGRTHRTFRSRLVDEFIKKSNLKQPWDIFSFSKKVWDEFYLKKTTEEFEEKSQKGKELREKWKEPHRMGSTGYKGKEGTWKPTDTITIDGDSEGVGSTSIVIGDLEPRSQRYFMGRAVPTGTEGSYTFNPSDTATIEAFSRLQTMSQEVNSGSIEPQEMLSKAVGRPEYSGRTRGTSGFSNKSDLYGRKSRKNVHAECMTPGQIAHLMDAVTERCKNELRQEMTSWFLMNGVQIPELPPQFLQTPHQVFSAEVDSAMPRGVASNTLPPDPTGDAQSKTKPKPRAEKEKKKEKEKEKGKGIWRGKEIDNSNRARVPSEGSTILREERLDQTIIERLSDSERKVYTVLRLTPKGEELFEVPECNPWVLSTKDDEKVLLKIKKQLGDPDSLSWWVKGFDYCDASANTGTDFSYITCTDTGRVRSILLQNLNVTAPFPDAICELTEVQDLLLNNDPGLYGPIPSCVTELSNLWEVIIIDTSFSGPVPSFYDNPSLLFINLARNHLSGTIPSSFSALPKLISLDLSGNYLTGSIPPHLVHTSSPSLVLSNNSLTGELPNCYGSVDFSIIDVGGNQLTGDVSFLFGKQKNAVNIVLANNEFEFDLSNVEFSDNIYGFDLSHNKIYGKVPDSFATAAGLYYPNLSFNKLCGELPQGGNMWRFNAAVFANNSCLCGNPLPPCSTSAPAPAF